MKKCNSIFKFLIILFLLLAVLINYGNVTAQTISPKVTGKRVGNLVLDKCAKRVTIPYKLYPNPSGEYTDRLVIIFASNGTYLAGIVVDGRYNNELSSDWNLVATLGSSPNPIVRTYWKQEVNLAMPFQPPSYIPQQGNFSVVHRNESGNIYLDISWENYNNYSDATPINVLYVYNISDYWNNTSKETYTNSDMFNAFDISFPSIPEITFNSLAPEKDCGNKVKFSWGWSHDNIKGYWIHLSKTPDWNGERKSVEVAANQTSATIEVPDASWYNIPIYGDVEGISNCGNVQKGSGWQTMTGQLKQPPTASVITSAVVNSNNDGIIVNWTNSSSDIEKFKIERSNKNGSVSYDIDDPSVRTYEDKEAGTCTDYFYRIRTISGCNTNGVVSLASSAIKLPINIAISFTPNKNLSCSKGYFNDKIQLDWDCEHFDQIEKFIISRKKYGISDTYIEIASVNSTKQYNDETADPGVLYQYKIKGITACGDTPTYTNESFEVVGMRSSSATVNGHIQFENGQAVKNAMILVTKSSGQNGTCLSFNGTDNYAFVPSGLLALTKAITIETWVNPSLTKSNNYILSKGTDYELYLDNQQPVFKMNNKTFSITNAENTFIANQWNHIAVTYNKAIVKIFVNGVLKASQAYSTDINLSQNNVFIGKSLGSDFFAGKVDEVRIWNIAKTDEDIFKDYSRTMEGGEKGLIAAWSFDENVGEFIFDRSHKDVNYNANHGTLKGTNYQNLWSSYIPTVDQLSVKGYTDDNGNYSIGGIKYEASGQNFIVTPFILYHEFNPGSKTLFLGNGSNIVNNVDFIDKSAFDVSGFVKYSGCDCFADGIDVLIDGKRIIIDGKVVQTDKYGKFLVKVPIGRHKLSVDKSLHTFANNGQWPPPDVDYPDGIYDYKEPITGIEFIDETKIIVVGRVAGGSKQAAFKPGMGLSTNNIGIADLKFTEEGNQCIVTKISTDFKTGEYIVQLPPKRFLVSGPSGYENSPVRNNTDIKFDFQPLDLTKSTPLIEDFQDIPVYEDIVVSINPVTAQFTYFLEGISYEDKAVISGTTAYLNIANSSYTVTLISTTTNTTAYLNVLKKIEKRTIKYHVRSDYIYRSKPGIIVTNEVGLNFFGEKSITAEYKGVKTPINLKTKPFDYPVFVMGNEYKLIIYAFEKYENYDYYDAGNPKTIIKDSIPIQDGNLIFNNGLALQEKDEAKLNSDGFYTYSFIGGFPNMSYNVNFPHLSFTKPFTIALQTKGLVTQWLPNKVDADGIFRAYVFGFITPANEKDIITEGPQIVKNILRDPPGSNSFASIKKGHKHVFTETWSIGGGINASYTQAIYAKPTFILGIGYETITEAGTSINLGFNFSSKAVRNSTVEETYEWNETISTSNSPELAGAPSDIFFGSSNNYVVGNTINVGLINKEIKDNYPNIGKEVNEFTIGKIVMQTIAPYGEPTYFYYTQDHIQNYLIPFLVTIRNNILLNNKDYESKLAISDPMFGSNNDDPRWKEKATSKNPFYYDKGDEKGESYEFKAASDPKKRDDIRWYNQQIRLWQEAIERNEREKMQAELKKNISFDAGTIYSFDETTTNSNGWTVHWEAMLGFDFDMKSGGKVGGVGVESALKLGLTIEANYDKSKNYTDQNTYSYTLADPDQGDYISVDIMDPKTGTSTVFKIKGGRTLCPYEGKDSAYFYKPKNYKITTENFEYIKTALNTSGAKKIEAKFKDFIKYVSGIYKTEKFFTTFLTGKFEEYINLAKTTSLIELVIDDMEDKMMNKVYSNESELQDAINELTSIKILLVCSKFKKSFDMDTTFLKESLGKDIKPLPGEESVEFDFVNFFIKDLYQFVALYSGYITDFSTQYLNAGTIQREKPAIECVNPYQGNIFEDKKAYFKFNLKNDNENGETMWYSLRVLDETNPSGAIVKMDGFDLNNKVVEIPGGKSIQRIITVEKGDPSVFQYKNIGILIVSTCDWAYHTNGRTLKIADTAYISVDFIPACTDVKVDAPLDNFVINYDSKNLDNKYIVSIDLKDYKINDNLQNITLQYKTESAPNWNSLEYYWNGVIPTGKTGLLIPGDKISFKWNITGVPDAKYQVRAVTGCLNDVKNANEPIGGIFDRVCPINFGSPQPADGILKPGDEIMIEFNEAINQGRPDYSYFDITGVLNGTDLSHGASVFFDGTFEKYMIIDFPMNLIQKSFTAEMWVKRSGTGEQCLLSQGSDAANGFWMGFDANKKFVFNLAGQSVSTDNDPFIGDGNTPAWHHVAAVYNYQTGVVYLYVDGVMLKTQTINVNYTGQGRMYAGKRTFGTPIPMNGNVHELRLWSSTQSIAGLIGNMNKMLSGKELGLMANWRMDEGMGTIIRDYSSSRHARLQSKNMWKVDPAGEAMNFNGTDGYLTMKSPDIAFSFEKNFSIEFWFKSTNKANVCFLSNGRGDNSDNNPLGWSICTDASGDIYVKNNGLMFKAADASVFDGDWHHFALVMNRLGNITSFIDGNQIYSTPGKEWNEFGGQEILIGARRDSRFNAVPDMFFNGMIDEVRIWEFNKSQSIIQQDINFRMNGDETGLLAYLPFEQYEIVGGVMLLKRTIVDGISANKHIVTKSGSADYAGQSPNIKLTRPVKKVNFNWVTQENKVLFNITDPPSLIENCLLTITTKKIQDLHDNWMQSPVVWTAYVKLNQVVWVDNYFELKKELYAPLTFEAEISNESGMDQKFEINNLPPWLTVDFQNGNIAPLSKKKIKFTISEGINTGYYNQDIYLRSDFAFDEKLILNLRVYKPEPNWTVDPSKFSYTMNLFGQLKIDGILSTDIYDKVAVFAGNECRGIANLTYVKEYDMYEVFLDIYSNVSSENNLKFYVWDADKGRMYIDVIPILNFQNNSVIGTPSSPIMIEAQNIVEVSLNLSKGWNWVSFNLNSANLTNLNNLFTTINAKNGDEIKTDGPNAKYNIDGGKWIGDIESKGGILSTKMYMMNLGNDNILTYSGTIIDPKNKPISLVSGWNWIGFIPQVNISVKEALAGLTLESGDIIKSLSNFAMYDKYMGWIGSLKYLKPGCGYMLKVKNSGDLFYPQSGLIKSAYTEFIHVPLQMSINPSDFSTNMTMVASIDKEFFSITKNDVLYAMAGNECRGFGYTVFNEVTKELNWFVMLYGKSNEQLTFFTKSASNNKIISFKETIRYSNNATVGTLNEPFLFSVSNIFEGNEQMIMFSSSPNPFTDQTTFFINDNNTVDKKIVIYDILGKLIATLQVVSNKVIWNGTDKNGNKVIQGIYLAKYGTTSIRIIKN